MKFKWLSAAKLEEVIDQADAKRLMLIFPLLKKPVTVLYFLTFF